MSDIAFKSSFQQPAMPVQRGPGNPAHTPGAPGVPVPVAKASVPSAGGRLGSLFGTASAASAASAASLLSGDTDTTELSDFNGLAAIIPRRFTTKALHLRRRLDVKEERARSAKGKKTERAKIDGEDDEDAPIFLAAVQTLNLVHEEGRGRAESELASQYDPLERYALLYNAQEKLEEQDWPQAEKDYVRAQVNRMMSELMFTHRDQIRDGMRATQDLEATLGVLAERGQTHPDSWRELRFIYGTKGNSKTDAPLTPLAMAKVLHQKFGGENFIGALGSLRSKMAGDLRTSRVREMGPRLWLSMSDAAAFNAVQSSYAIAGDLRRELVEKARVMPKTNHVNLTLTLLSVAEAGKGKAGTLVGQIVDLKNADLRTKARAYPIVTQAVRKLPITMWPQDRLPQRLELLDELSRQVLDAHKALPLPQMQAEQWEKQWREALAQKAVAG